MAALDSRKRGILLVSLILFLVWTGIFVASTSRCSTAPVGDGKTYCNSLGFAITNPPPTTQAPGQPPGSQPASLGERGETPTQFLTPIQQPLEVIVIRYLAAVAATFTTAWILTKLISLELNKNKS